MLKERNLGTVRALRTMLVALPICTGAMAETAAATSLNVNHALNGCDAT